MRGKIERPNRVGLFKELLFIKSYILGLHPTLNLKKNVKYFLKSSWKRFTFRMHISTRNGQF
jgi:hypothetical protein